jgi:hypothetical protein
VFRDFSFPAVVALVGVAGRNSMSIQFMKTRKTSFLSVAFLPASTMVVQPGTSTATGFAQ